MSRRRRTCVQDRNTKLWCALVRRADPDAWSDELLCGCFMALRGHTERRVPTCPECLVALRESQQEETKP
jgi:hypothetical protein